MSRNFPNDLTLRKLGNAWENLKLELRLVPIRPSVSGSYGTGSQSYRKTDIETLLPFPILLIFFTFRNIFLRALSEERN